MPETQETERFGEGFDIQAARNSGISDAKIAEFLAEGSGFDIGAARKSGVQDTQISNFLVTGQQPKSVGGLQATGEGIVGGLSEIAGLGGSAREAIEGTLLSRSLGFESDFAKSRVGQGILEALSPSGGTISRELGLSDPESLPSGERALFKGGRVVGSSVPFGLAPVALARGAALPAEAVGSQVSGRTLTNEGLRRFASGGGLRKLLFGPGRAKEGGLGLAVLESARRSPTSFLLAEGGQIGGAATAAAFAEALDPGDVGTALISEVAGGFVNPVGLLGRVSGGSKNSLLRVIGSFSKAGREQRASEIINTLLEESGENLDDLLRLLDASTIRKGTTSAQKTGSQTLLAIEKRLAAQNTVFRGFAAKGERNALESLRKAADDLAASGDPAALRVAAKLQSQYFDELLDQQIDVARRAALDAQGAIGGGSKAARSKKVAEALDGALAQARQAETDLWDQIPKNQPIRLTPLSNEGGSGLIFRTTDALNRLLPEELAGLGPVVKAAQRIVNKPNVTSGDLLKLRRRALKEARSAQARGDFTERSVLNDIAEGALDDLAQLQGKAVDDARAFSVTLNDKFTRSFGGKALAKDKLGNRRIPPELLLEQALGGGGTRGSMRFRELRETGDFGGELLGAVRNEQEEFLRAAASETITNGRVDPGRLERFVLKNSDVLDEFPALKAQLGSAAEAERAFAGVEAATSTSRLAAKEEAFSIILGNESPRRAVADVLKGRNPSRHYQGLAKVARGGNATEGLMSATIDYAVQKATSATGEFSLAKFRRALTEPLGRGQPTLLGMMRSEKILSAQAGKRLNQILKEAEDLERTLASGKQIEKLLDDPNGIFDLVVRITGAKIGAVGASGTTGATIVAAGAGSRVARNFFEKVPNTRIQDVLIEAAQDPAFMAALLRKPKTIKAQRELQRQINGFLIGAGIIATGDIE